MAEKHRTRRGLVITIDGPAGAGKSTVAQAIARRLGYLYIDTGAMYRAVALKVLRRGGLPSDRAALVALLKDTRIELEAVEGGTRVYLDGDDVTADIRTPAVSAIVSEVAALPEVREAMVREQRRLAARGGVVLEGRDTGSHVAPEADWKFFLTAAFDERVDRRHAELRARGYAVNREQVAADIRERDRIDSTRALAPLSVPEGAVVIDTTGMDVAEVVAHILSLLQEGRSER